MSNKTVIQKLLTTLEENFKKYSKSHQTSVSHAERKTYYDLMTSTETFMVILETALPAEKQMIMDAYQAGFEQDTVTDPETYYNVTFNPNI